LHDVRMINSSDTRLIGGGAKPPISSECMTTS
jgi:hypothetical protein